MKFAQVKHTIESSFGSVVLISFLIGFFLPGLSDAPDELISVTIALIIFLACFRMEVADFNALNKFGLLGFYALRYIGLPFVLFYLVGLYSTTFAIGILLLSLMPAGVMSPAMAALLGGSAATSLALVVISSLLCPLVVPLAFYFTTEELVSIDVVALFRSLAIVLVLPIVVHIPCRKQPKLRAWIHEQNTFVTMLLLGITIALVAAQQRGVLREDPGILLTYLSVLVPLYLLYYGLPWFGLRRFTKDTQIACALSSGANNNLLGIGLALLHFGPEISLFMVLTEIPWIISLSVLHRLAATPSGRPLVIDQDTLGG